MVKDQGILIDKTGELKEVKINDINNLYKTCKLKKPDNFELRHTWNVKIKSEKYNIKLHAKNEGRANSENKYDLPPPVDNELYFGSMLLLAYDDDNLINLSLELWEKIYEKLFGGFENLKDTEKEDEEEEDELDNVPDNMKTKEGYLKDGFIVDNDDDDIDDDIDDEDDDDDEEEDNIDSSEDNDDEDEDEDEINECGSELAFEDYVYSDDD
jgi:hypothetical protein